MAVAAAVMLACGGILVAAKVRVLEPELGSRSFGADHEHPCSSITIKAGPDTAPQSHYHCKPVTGLLVYSSAACVPAKPLCPCDAMSDAWLVMTAGAHQQEHLQQQLHSHHRRHCR